jgi:hypothetical protein
MTEAVYYPSYPCPCCNPSLHAIANQWLRVVTSGGLSFLGNGSLISKFAFLDRASTTSQTEQSYHLDQGNTSLNQSQIADAIYINGTVITVNDAQPTAEAIAIKDGKIFGVGSQAEIDKLRGEDTQIIDLEGKTLVPGFIDGHGHVVGQGIVAALAANLLPSPDGPVDSIASLQAELRNWIQVPASKALGLIFGFGYDDSQLLEKRHPNRDDLDAISTELPIVLVHQSGHLGAYNSKALELFAITADTPNPPGGVIQRRPGSQEPNGVLEETAHLSVLVTNILPRIKPDVLQSLGVGPIEKGIETYAQYGFTTVQEGAGTPLYLEALKQEGAANRLQADVALYLLLQPGVNLQEIDWPRGEYRGHLRLAGGKLVADGSVQGRTGWLSQPYYQQAEGQPDDYAGYPTYTDEQLRDAIELGFKNNFQVLVHSNGDAATDQLIRIVKALTEKYGKADRRLVLIHGQVLREDQLDAIKELDIFPSLFPSHTFYWGDWHRDVTLGPDRAARISPTQSALQRGIKFSIHNDAPVVRPHALRLLWSAVNRRTRSNQILGADQQITPLEGLKALTIWSAYQHFEEDHKGSIEVGKLADFAILSDNPLTVAPLTIKDIQVLETIKEGKSIYKANSKAT